MHTDQSPLEVVQCMKYQLIKGLRQEGIAYGRIQN